VKLTFQVPNPEDPDSNRKVFEAFKTQVGDATIIFKVPLNEEGTVFYEGQAPLIAIEGDHYDGSSDPDPDSAPEQRDPSEPDSNWRPIPGDRYVKPGARPAPRDPTKPSN